MNARQYAKVASLWGSAIALSCLLGSVLPVQAQSSAPPDNATWQMRQAQQTHRPFNPASGAEPSSLAMQALSDEQLERRGAYRLVGNDPNLPLDDLEPLEDIIGDAQVVGLGHEFPSAGGSYIMKHRVIRFLVKRMGFRVMGIESPYFWSQIIEQYLQSGRCPGLDPADLKKSTFSSYASAEFGAQIEWMCQWNLAHPNDKLHVFGFDAQLSVTANMAALSGSMTKMGFGASDPMMSGMNACDGMAASYFPNPMPQAAYDQCQSSLSAAMNYLIQNEASVRNQLSREEYFMALAHGRTLQAYQEALFFMNTDPSRSSAAREHGLADVFMYIRDGLYPGQRAVLWAEDESVAMNGLQWTYPDPKFMSGGDLLKQHLGRDYVAIGMVSLHLNLSTPFVVGGVSNGGCGETNLRYGGPGPYVEDALHAAGGGSSLLVDLDMNQRHDDRRDDTSNSQSRERGRKHGKHVLLDPNTKYAWTEIVPVIMQDTFDALIYQDTVTAAHYAFDMGCPGS